jgi:hypothetical protein
MHGESHGILTGRDRRGRFKAGNTASRGGREAKLIRITAKIEELSREYDDGSLSAVDRNRLMLAARHYVTAETTNNLNQSIRATRCAEMLLSRIRRQEVPTPSLQELLAGAE